MHDQPDCFLWQNDSSCVHEVTTINAVRLSALSPTAFLPRSWGSTGWIRLLGGLKTGWAPAVFVIRSSVSSCELVSSRVPSAFQGLILFGVFNSDWKDETFILQDHTLSRFVDDTELGWAVDELNVRGPIQMHLDKFEGLANRNFKKVNEEKFCRGIPCIS